MSRLALFRVSLVRTAVSGSGLRRSSFRFAGGVVALGVIGLVSTAAFAQATPAEETSQAEAGAEQAAGEAATTAAPPPADGSDAANPPLGVHGMRRSNEYGYGPAGCGLGSLLFRPDSGFTQVLAATTNGVFGNQTFGISTGTSNCVDTKGGSASTAAFVETNRTALAKDIARGQGETLQSLSKLAGCAPEAPVGLSLQRNFQVIFPTAVVSDADVSSAVLRVLKSDAALQCRALS